MGEWFGSRRLIRRLNACRGCRCCFDIVPHVGTPSDALGRSNNDLACVNWFDLRAITSIAVEMANEAPFTPEPAFLQWPTVQRILVEFKRAQRPGDDTIVAEKLLGTCTPRKFSVNSERSSAHCHPWLIANHERQESPIGSGMPAAYRASRPIRPVRQAPAPAEGRAPTHELSNAAPRRAGPRIGAMRRIVRLIGQNEML